MAPKFIPLTLFLATVAAAAACPGCLSFDGTPRDRLGALPYPGLLTLYDTADPAHLGRHRYEGLPRLLQTDEAERGIIYTARAGFLDLAHVRIAIDWTRYCTRAVAAAVRDRREALAIPCPEGDVFHLAVRYPAGWSALPAADRERAADAVARQVGPRVAYLMLTWHEVATWFGYRTVFFVDESRSAFSYDDSVAHLVGLRVADRAMCDAGRDADDQAFDAAVTVALDAELRRLGAVSPDRTDEAARAVEGRWWAAGQPLKRQFDVCPGESTVVYPWLVPGWPSGASRGPCASSARALPTPHGTPPADERPPEPFPLPTAAGVAGPWGEVAATVAVEPRTGAARSMRDLLPARPARLDEHHDLPALLAVMRSQMRDRYGSAVGQP
jgi:hypothetical protein